MAAIHTARTAQAEAREFAAQYPTANVRAAVRYAEDGILTWTQVRDLFARSLGSALAAEVR